MTKSEKAAYDRERYLAGKVKKGRSTRDWKPSQYPDLKTYQREYARKRRKNNPRAAHVIKDWQTKNRERIRRVSVKRQYGVTPEQHDRMLLEQGFKCGFRSCGEPVTLYSCVDHDHQTGKVRGVLCAGHNKGLGYFETTKPQCLLDAYEYLLRIGQ